MWRCWLSYRFLRGAALSVFSRGEGLAVCKFASWTEIRCAANGLLDLLQVSQVDYVDCRFALQPMVRFEAYVALKGQWLQKYSFTFWKRLSQSDFFSVAIDCLDSVPGFIEKGKTRYSFLRLRQLHKRIDMARGRDVRNGSKTAASITRIGIRS